MAFRRMYRVLAAASAQHLRTLQKAGNTMRTQNFVRPIFVPMLCFYTSRFNDDLNPLKCNVDEINKYDNL